MADINKNIKVGDIVSFGAYPQTKDGNDKTPIEWIVLDNKDGEAFLLSKYALDCKPYHDKYEPTVWAKSSVRAWLNDEFYNKAFSEAEKASVVCSDVVNNNNAQYGVGECENTKDFVFLMSIEEMFDEKCGFESKYNSGNINRRCVPTEYAKAQGASVAQDEVLNSEFLGNCWWWLRTAGLNNFRAALIHISGGITGNGDYVREAHNAIRPAIRVKVK